MAKSLGSKIQLPNSPLIICVTLEQVLNFPLPWFHFYKMEISAVTPAEDGSEEYTNVMLQMVMTP